MSDSLLLVRDEGSARILSFNRPEKRNALSLELLEELDAAIEHAATTKEIRSLIITGEGASFSAGIDLMSLAAAGMNARHADFRRLAQRLQELHNKLARLEKPVLAVLHGHCLGMALEMALACDFRIAEVGTDIHIGEVRVGLIPDVGGSTRLVRTIGLPRAKELIMTGKNIDADTALAWGLVNELVDSGQGLARALQWHAELEKGAPLAVGLSKLVLERAYDLDIHTSQQIEGLAQSTLFGTEDFREGVMARMEKRDPKWKGE
ncbi:MAG: enoyl-CoA hydratase/isomerase family protein [Candidatus Lernaella stagnicola]|nr:enoyl-CoA hydratase/isomerase family protein [Candidatus Lernaella stagnicola]